MNNLFLTYLIGCTLLVLLLFLSIVYGTIDIPIEEVFNAILYGLNIKNGEMDTIHTIIFDLRIPRSLFAIIIGSGLGLVGCVLQTTTRNQLADPFLFGLSSGASAGAIFVITITGDIIGIWTLPIAAFIGGMLASIIVISIVHFLRTSSPEKLILSGLAISFLFTAITNYLIFSGDSRAAHSIIFWMLGGLGLARWESLPLITFGLIAIFVFSMYQKKNLDALLIGDKTATTLGVDVLKLRFSIFLFAALATSLFVSVSGVIGFIGLMVPHISRKIVGHLHGKLIPMTMMVGAIIMLLSDILCRILLAPQEIPLGIITTSIGSIFVLMILFNLNKRH